VLSFWLTGVTLYFLSSRLQNIKVIPVSLFVVALLAAWGPQSASAVSKQSQLKRLFSFFEQKSSVINGKLVPLTNTSGSGEATEILRYLVNRHGPGALRGYLQVDPDSLTRSADTLKYRYAREYERFELLRRYLKLQYSYETAEEIHYYSAETTTGDSLSISGYRHLVKVQYPVYYTDAPYTWNVDETRFSLNGKSYQATFDLRPVAEQVVNKCTGEVRYIKVPVGELYCMDETTGHRLIIEYLSFRLDNGKPEIQNFNGVLLLR
jgi:hypothetical protein